jgi:hypothetical protein
MPLEEDIANPADDRAYAQALRQRADKDGNTRRAEILRSFADLWDALALDEEGLRR